MKVHFCLWKSSCLRLFVEKTILAPVNLPLYLYQKSVVHICLNLCLHSILFHDLFFVLMPLLHYFEYCIFIMSLEIWSFPLFFIVVLAISGSSHIHTNSVICFLVSKCKSLLEFWFDCVERIDQCEDGWQYTVFFTAFVIVISASYFWY